MTTDKNNDLAATKAKLLVERKRYYLAENRDSEFNSLPGHIQRAIEREANFQIDSLIKSDTYAEHLNGINAKELFDAHCEYYAHKGIEQENLHPHHPQNLFEILKERDSRAVRNQEDKRVPDMQSGKTVMESSYENKTQRHAATIDEKASRINRAGGNYNTEQRIANLIAMRETRIK